MAYTVREETDMKIPASKVPAQVWADRARAHYGNLKKMEKDVLGYWEENKQVYRMNDALWDEMSIDEAEEFPMSLLDRLPYDCVFIQHRETIEIPFVFRGHELSGTVEREGYFCFRDAEGAECGRCERPLRASSASGERVALAASETVPAGTVLEFSILVMNPKDAETVREWLDYGALRGLFQWRNSGKGRFEWEEVAKED